MAQIWIPGLGVTSTEVRAVDRAVNEYDERLSFSRNEETGDWCVFMAMPHGQRPLPILGFQEVPTPETVLRRLHKADTLRHGEKILDSMNRQNEAIKQRHRDKAAQGAEAAAEGFDWLYRKYGLHPSPRIFVP